MVPAHTSVAEAYQVLGLGQDASLDDVKSTYKRIALRTHPDKNPDNPDATAEFQRVGDAYNTLLTHLDPAVSADPYWEDYEEDSDDEDYAYERMDFYRFLFEELFRRSQSRTYPSRRGYRRTREAQPPGETAEEYQARIRRSREEQLAAEKRRKEETAARKLRNEQERERDRQLAEQRRLDGIKAKKEQAESERRDAEAMVLKARRIAQEKRSTIFAAARAGNNDVLKRGVWEEGVDPTGGEVNTGCEAFVTKMPDDPKETLLHIAAKQGNLDMVDWLQSHNANSEEARNSDGLTPFHVALQLGHIDIVKYFFEAHDPKDEDFVDVYSTPKSTTLLSLAVLSHEPEVVWMVLDRSLASTEDINASWSWITSAKGRSVMAKRANHKNKVQLERFDDIVMLIQRYGDFTPPPSPSVSEPEDEAEPAPQNTGQHAKPSGSKHRRAESRTPNEMSSSETPPSEPQRGSGRGRGRGRGRGFSRGRGRGQTHVSPV